MHPMKFSSVCFSFALAASFWTSASFGQVELSRERMESDLRVLTGVEAIQPGVRLADRFTDENRKITRTFITERLRTLGYEPSFETFDVQSLDLTLNGTNVIAELKGTAAPEH